MIDLLLFGVNPQTEYILMSILAIYMLKFWVKEIMQTWCLYKMEQSWYTIGLRTWDMRSHRWALEFHSWLWAYIAIHDRWMGNRLSICVLSPIVVIGTPQRKVTSSPIQGSAESGWNLLTRSDWETWTKGEGDEQPFADAVGSTPGLP